MNKKILYLLYAVLLFASVAWTPLPHTPASFPSDTPITTYRPVQITAPFAVRVRDNADVVRDWLKPGDIIMAICYGGWCYLDNGYKVYQNCTSAALPGSKCRGRK